jgi:K+-transporting ATPase KdpF subunit
MPPLRKLFSFGPTSNSTNSDIKTWNIHNFSHRPQRPPKPIQSSESAGGPLLSDSYTLGRGLLSNSYAKTWQLIAQARWFFAFLTRIKVYSWDTGIGNQTIGFASSGAFHDGHHHAGDRRRLLCRIDRLRLRLRPAVTGSVMIFDYSLAGLVTAGLLVYLVYALLKPERF